MKEVTVDTLSNGEFTFKASILYYESVEEGDAVGGEGSMLREANLNLDYRGARQDVRDILVEVVQDLTGIKPIETDTGEKDDKGQPILEVTEKDGKFIVRAITSSGISNDVVQAELTRRCKGYKAEDGTDIAALAVDVRKRVRQAPKSKKLAQEYLDTAAKLLAGPNMSKLNDKLQSSIGKQFTPTGDSAADAKGLGTLLKEYTDHKNRLEKDALAQLG